MAESDRESEAPGSGSEAPHAHDAPDVADDAQADAEALQEMTTGNGDDLETPTDRLDHIIDDTDGREEAVKWTENQLLTGAAFEVVTAELVSQGWAEPSAIAIVEEARESTRQARGVRTRDDVVIGVYRKFGRTMRRVRWLIIIGIAIVIIAISMIVNRGQ